MVVVYMITWDVVEVIWYGISKLTTESFLNFFTVDIIVCVYPPDSTTGTARAREIISLSRTTRLSSSEGLRPCWLHVASRDKRVSWTNIPRSFRSVPMIFQRTTGSRSAFSAALFVGETAQSTIRVLSASHGGVLLAHGLSSRSPAGLESDVQLFEGTVDWFLPPVCRQRLQPPVKYTPNTAGGCC